jgi:hypothetical protein
LGFIGVNFAIAKITPTLKFQIKKYENKKCHSHKGGLPAGRQGIQ